MSDQQLSLEPYRGTRDFYPEDMALQNYIFGTMRSVAERFGYVEYGASILEETALYRAKSGSEIVNEQTYSFVDRGEREVTIRPEMTPTVARMVARARKELAFPLRWYSIPNLFRYERPQKGRLREHWQLNVDLFGVGSLEADAEIISVAWHLMKAFGAGDEQFVVRLNNRKLLNALIHNVLLLDEQGGHTLSKLIDRKHKMSEEEFLAQAKELLGEKTEMLAHYLNAGNVQELPEQLKTNEGANELQELQTKLDERGIGNMVFDPSLVRGFDYYTGTVFEVFDTNPDNSRSLFGGGRYDDLVGMFGVEKVSGVGFGMGDVTIKDFLATYNLLPAYQASTLLYLCRLKPEHGKFAQELADYLREKGINVALDYTNRKIDAQIKTAEKQGIPYIICIGEDEVANKQFKLKHLPTRQKQTVSWDELPGILLAQNDKNDQTVLERG